MGICICAQIGIFDAGSTGTRLKLYEFDQKRLISQATYKQDSIQNPKGIHLQTVSELEKMMERFKPVFNRATRLGFYGTAGMRALPKERQDGILQNVTRSLKEFNLSETKVLSGREEAVFALKAFEFYFPEEDDFNIIDMGGRSVQLIYKRKNLVRVNSLEMGVLNGDCSERKNVWKSGLLEGIENPADQVSITVETCQESVDAKGDKVYECHRDPIKYTINPRNGSSIASFLIENGTVKYPCVDEFFKRNTIARIEKTSKTFLMSYFEDLIPKNEYSEGTLSLETLFDRFRAHCVDSSDQECKKMYYSLRFLESVGLDRKNEMILINKKFNFDISWSLGAALSLNTVS